jgi:hypothetical protein
MNVYIVITIVMVMLLSDFGPYEIIFMTVFLLIQILLSFLMGDLLIS